MAKFIIIILLGVGAFYVYQNQDTLLQSAEGLFKKEKTVVKVNNASKVKQEVTQDAMNKALEY